MADYLSLEEAAKKLGIPTDRLVELRSQGKVRGFRDGSSWKFPEASIDQLQDELADAISGDSDLMMDGGSDDLQEIDSADLQLNDPAIMHDSAQLDLGIEPNAGSTGPVTDEELKEISESHPDVLKPESGAVAGSDLDLGGDDIKLSNESDLSFSGPDPDDDSGEELIGDDEDDSVMSSLGGDSGSDVAKTGASSLELMDELKLSGDSNSGSAAGSRGVDVLSELDLLSAEQSGSGLISGDSENLLMSSGLGSSVGADALSGSDVSGIDDALEDDDDLVIADDDDDLVISSGGSDISVAGDSGINLMSPSDSGLSLESEPLDLAGSSISALDLGAELADGSGSGSGSGSGGGSGSGSMVDFQADEEFQLSPSGVGLDADIESGSQVIEVEDSAEVGEAVEFEDDNFGDADPLGGDVFGGAPEEVALADDDGEAIAIDERATPASAGGGGMRGYEIPFSLLQCVTLMLILLVLGLSGMLMTDLVRNMWTYNEPSAPVSSLTDSLIGLMGWGQ